MPKTLDVFDGDGSLAAIFEVDEETGELVEIAAAADAERAALAADLDLRGPNWIARIAMLSQWADLCRQRARDETARARRFEAAETRMREWLRLCMESCGRKKLGTDRGTASLREPTRRKLDIQVPVETLPERFRTASVKWVPDESAILAALDAGERIDGVCVMEPQCSLVVRT